jgi:hypothetical protein
MVPRLRVLRLRLRFFCTDIFELLEETAGESGVGESNLETVLLLFAPRAGSVGSQSTLLQTRLCGTFERPQIGEAFEHMSIYCHGLSASGKLPQLQSFKLIDRSNGNDGNGYKIYNAMNDESKTVTFASAMEEGILSMEPEETLISTLTPYQTTLENRLVDVVEGSAAWEDSSWGARQPTSVSET